MITNYFENLIIEKPVVKNGFCVFPVSVCDRGKDFSYLLLDKALKKNLVTITELHPEGSVNKLKIVNRATVPVLIFDGQELKGAKQNRVINTSVLVPEESELILPVSCSERDRWQYRTANFEATENIIPGDMRTRKNEKVYYNLASEGTYSSDQNKIWEEIEKLHLRSGTDKTSKTRALQDVYVKRSKDLDKLLNSYAPVDEQQGVMIVYKNKVVALEVFSDPAVYSEMYEKVLKSYLLDNLKVNTKGNNDNINSLWKTANQFIYKCKRTEFSRYKSPGYGWDYRFRSDNTFCSILEYDGAFLHILVLAY